VWDELCARDFTIYGGTGETIHGLEEWKQHYDELMDAFPDLHSTIDDMFAEGDKVAVRWTLTGTHKGVHRGIPPTNRKMTAWGIHIYRFSGGKLMEIWERFDTLNTVQQLGAMPILK
jgi:steroid delta-isomerase-like uncharacterized protein